MSITQIEKEISDYSKNSGLSKTDLRKICLERGLESLKKNGITLTKKETQSESKEAA